jgi:hypothetical protein
MIDHDLCRKLFLVISFELIAILYCNSFFGRRHFEHVQGFSASGVNANISSRRPYFSQYSKTALSFFTFQNKDDYIDFGNFEEGKVEVTRGPNNSYFLYYRVYNARQQEKPETINDKIPLVVVHGGP